MRKDVQGYSTVAGLPNAGASAPGAPSASLAGIIARGLELVDTHAHTNFDAFDGDRAEMYARARAAGVAAIVEVGVGLERRDQLPVLLRGLTGDTDDDGALVRKLRQACSEGVEPRVLEAVAVDQPRPRGRDQADFHSLDCGRCSLRR